MPEEKFIEIPEYIQTAIKTFLKLFIQLYFRNGRPFFDNINFYLITRIIHLRWPYLPVTRIIRLLLQIPQILELYNNLVRTEREFMLSWLSYIRNNLGFPDFTFPDLDEKPRPNDRTSEFINFTVSSLFSDEEARNFIDSVFYFRNFIQNLQLTNVQIRQDTRKPHKVPIQPQAFEIEIIENEQENSEIETMEIEKEKIKEHFRYQERDLSNFLNLQEISRVPLVNLQIRNRIQNLEQEIQANQDTEAQIDQIHV